MFVVKGISRQVILVRPGEEKLFEQAIFILREDATGVTDEMLLKEAGVIAGQSRRIYWTRGPVWACAGALCTGVIWLLCVLL